jgi:hypothetical protein
METLLHALLALATLVVPVACAYIVVRRLVRDRERRRQGE